MKITRRDLGVLMIIAGILIAFLAYKMSFEGTMEEIEAIQGEQAKLKAEIESLKPLVAESEKWEKAKKEMADGLNNMMNEFSPDVWQEDNILSVVDMLDELKVKIPNFSAEEAKVEQSVDGEGSFAGVTYTLAKASVSMSYEVESYPDLKEYIDFVYSKKNQKRLIDTISMSFNKEDGTIAGTTTVLEYVMNDSTRPYKQPTLPKDNIGIENENENSIFGETEESKEQ